MGTDPGASPWWKSGVIYQIYPRSFQDSDGDGIGDLEGLRRRLEHLAWLGVDALWLSPIHPSPQRDFGYDISDYCGVDPLFGDLDAFDRLVAEARRLGLRVILDLVVNHSSDQHPWFQASRSSQEDPKRDWYLWRPMPDGRPPNNWASVFGGSAWQRDEATGAAYLHSFLPEQPDLNWRNPAVEAAVHDVMRFWLDRGVSGFRLDVYNCYLKDAEFRDNPRTWNPLGLLYRYVGQRHVHDRDQPELVAALARMRAVVDARPGGLLVGETLAEGDYAAAGRFSGPQGLHLAFHFAMLHAPWRAAALRAAIDAQAGALLPEAWPTLVFNNHDFPRFVSRMRAADREAQAKVAATALLTLRGTPFLYYGEELGLPEVRIPRARIQDPVGKRFWPFHRGRDGCRTPMPWDSSDGAGFSAAAPWLPLNEDARTRNVAAQRADPGSLLHVYRRLLALRRASPALRAGTQRLLPETARDTLGWIRRAPGEEVLVLLNLSGRARAPTLPDGDWRVLFSTKDRLLGDTLLSARLEPQEALVASRSTGASEELL